jgi:hypothetical protein
VLISLDIATFIVTGTDELAPTAFVGDPRVVEKIIFHPRYHIHITNTDTCGFATFKFLEGL